MVAMMSVGSQRGSLVVILLFARTARLEVVGASILHATEEAVCVCATEVGESDFETNKCGQRTETARLGSTRHGCLIAIAVVIAVAVVIVVELVWKCNGSFICAARRRVYTGRPLASIVPLRWRLVESALALRRCAASLCRVTLRCQQVVDTRKCILDELGDVGRELAGGFRECVGMDPERREL